MKALSLAALATIALVACDDASADEASFTDTVVTTPADVAVQTEQTVADTVSTVDSVSGVDASTDVAERGGRAMPDVVAPPEPDLTRMTDWAMTLSSDAMAGRKPGTPGGQAAREYLINELEACGVAALQGDTYEQPITTGVGTNVLGLIAGQDEARASRHVLVSAHYDHLGVCDGAICNGADDNAAAVAIVLSVACALAEKPAPRSVIIAFWDAEEPPTFLTSAMGSEFYAANPLVPLVDTDVAIVLDLVGAGLWSGYPGHFALGAEHSPEVAAAFDRTPIPDGLESMRLGIHAIEQTMLGHSPWSDYHGFRQRGVPFLFFANAMTKLYHTPADEFSTLDLPKMGREAQFLASLVEELTHAEVDPTFVADGHDYPTELRNGLRVLEDSLAPGGLVDALGLTPSSRQTLQGDLASIQALVAKLDAGDPLPDDVASSVEVAVQRVMCLAGNLYGESLCSLF